MEIPLCVAVAVVGIFAILAIALPTIKWRASSALIAGILFLAVHYGTQSQVVKLIDCPLSSVLTKNAEAPSVCRFS